MQFSVFSFRFSAVPRRLSANRRFACASPLKPQASSLKTRRGLSIIEVLAAIGVLSVGLLGLAALLPLGRLAISDAMRIDQTADCGRAALRDVRVRGLLDPRLIVGTYPIAANGSPKSYIIDPRGVANGLGTFGGIVPRVNLYASVTNQTPLSSTQADTIFLCPDDLSVSLPEQQSPPLAEGRPSIVVNTQGVNQFQGSYSWMLSVTPCPTDPVYSTNNANPVLYPYKYSVSVVVFDRRGVANTSPAGSERAVQVTKFLGVSSGQTAYGGGSVQLARSLSDISSDATAPADINVHEGDWVALVSKNSGLCQWYSVATVSDDNSTGSNSNVYMTLSGPDWVVDGSEYVVGVGKAIAGVYTTTVVLDQEPAWQN
jgi:hypothetical protein